jgi:hypothetical protein
MRLTVTYRVAPPLTVDRSRRAVGELAQHWPPGLQSPPPRALPRAGARPTLQLRLPDRNGRLPWGISALPADGGGWCTSGLRRVIGDRVGDVDYELGTFSDAGFAGLCPVKGDPPSRWSTTSASDRRAGPASQQQRTDARHGAGVPVRHGPVQHHDLARRRSRD